SRGPSPATAPRSPPRHGPVPRPGMPRLPPIARLAELVRHLLCANLAPGGPPGFATSWCPPPAMAIVLAARLTYGERATRHFLHARSADERGTVTGDPAGQGLYIG